MSLRKRKLPGKNRWRVYDGSNIIAKETTKSNADAQIRLLRGLKHGMKLRK